MLSTWFTLLKITAFIAKYAGSEPIRQYKSRAKRLEPVLFYKEVQFLYHLHFNKGYNIVVMMWDVVLVQEWNILYFIIATFFLNSVTL